jgi:hypothetical protein
MGSHWLKSKGISPKDLETWEIAVKYQFYHALGLLVLSQSRNSVPVANLLLTVGAVIFSGSLYTLVLTGQRWLGAYVFFSLLIPLLFCSIFFFCVFFLYFFLFSVLLQLEDLQ